MARAARWARGCQPLRRSDRARRGRRRALVRRAAGARRRTAAGRAGRRLRLVVAHRVRDRAGLHDAAQLVVVPLLLLFPPAVALPAVAAASWSRCCPDVLRGGPRRPARRRDRRRLVRGRPGRAARDRRRRARRARPLAAVPRGARPRSSPPTGSAATVIDSSVSGCRCARSSVTSTAPRRSTPCSPVRPRRRVRRRHASWAALLGPAAGRAARRLRAPAPRGPRRRARAQRDLPPHGRPARRRARGRRRVHRQPQPPRRRARRRRRRPPRPRPAPRHLVELGALLHDVGKIRIPKEILLKPGPLDDAEFAEMKRHTIYGQQLLDRVGGPLSRSARSSARPTSASTAAATRTGCPAAGSRSSRASSAPATRSAR